MFVGALPPVGRVWGVVPWRRRSACLGRLAYICGESCYYEYVAAFSSRVAYGEVVAREGEGWFDFIEKVDYFLVERMRKFVVRVHFITECHVGRGLPYIRPFLE